MLVPRDHPLNYNNNSISNSRRRSSNNDRGQQKNAGEGYQHKRRQSMSNQQPEESSRGIARVTFRVRCETLGHGEMVYLARVGDASGFRVSCEVT